MPVLFITVPHLVTLPEMELWQLLFFIKSSRVYIYGLKDLYWWGCLLHMGKCNFLDKGYCVKPCFKVKKLNNFFLYFTSLLVNFINIKNWDNRVSRRPFSGRWAWDIGFKPYKAWKTRTSENSIPNLSGFRKIRGF